MKAVLVDDEKAAREATRLMLQTFCSDVEVVADFNNVDAAAIYLNENLVDVVFLDIEMPGKNGFELFGLTDCSKLQIVFTTGHNEYAIKAFKYAACHYLLKPLIPDELINACRIARERMQLGVENSQLAYLKGILENKQSYPESIVVSIKQGYEIVMVNDIIRFEGERNYTWVITKEDKFLTSKSIKEFEEVLNPKLFYRIHQTHLVHRNYLKSIKNKDSASLLLLDKTELPISRHRKKDFIHWLENKS